MGGSSESTLERTSSSPITTWRRNGPSSPRSARQSLAFGGEGFARISRSISSG
jgi:hypothetical protein